MSEGDPDLDASPFAKRPGERLRAARVSQDLNLSDIAARTRIPQRHLEAIEAGDYSGLPSVTYAMGFAKAYARAVGVDEVGLAAEVRGEIADVWDRPAATPGYQVEDPARVPSRGLVWGGVLVAVLLLAGVALWYGTGLFRGTATPPAPATATGDVAVAIPDPAPAAAAAVPAGGGQVTITADDEVWVRIYDAAGTTLMMKTMAPGERYDVPPGAADPMINVGRPDKLSVTVNGSRVAQLGDGRLAIKDVRIGAAALLARRAAAATAPAASAPVPAAMPSAPAGTAPAGNAADAP